MGEANLARLTGLRANTIRDLVADKSYRTGALSRLAFALEADVRFVARAVVRIGDVSTRDEE